MKSFVAYTGGKGQVSDDLIARMPEEASQSYIELFLGGGSVFFAKEKAKVNILNDIEPDVVNMHQTVATQAEEVMAEMKRLPTSRLIYEQIRSLRYTGPWWELSDVERAARMIFLLGCAFNAKPRSPFPASTMTPLKYDAYKDLTPYAEHLRGATFECLHYAELLDRYLLRPKKLCCFVYCDPPYMAATSAAHYRYRFDAIDHLMLANKLARINQLNGGERSVKIMLTYDEHPYIRSLYRRKFGWHVGSLGIRYAGGHHTHETQELLITNYPIAVAAPIAQPVADIDWSDIPHAGLAIGGKPFDEMTCCERERLGLILASEQSGTCRACSLDVGV